MKNLVIGLFVKGNLTQLRLPEKPWPWKLSNLVLLVAWTLRICEKPGHWTVCQREFDTIKAARKALALEIKPCRPPSGLDIKNL